jgi:hypothetical protein
MIEARPGFSGWRKSEALLLTESSSRWPPLKGFSGSVLTTGIESPLKRSLAAGERRVLFMVAGKFEAEY